MLEFVNSGFCIKILFQDLRIWNGQLKDLFIGIISPLAIIPSPLTSHRNNVILYAMTIYFHKSIFFLQLDVVKVYTGLNASSIQDSVWWWSNVNNFVWARKGVVLKLSSYFIQVGMTACQAEDISQRKLLLTKCRQILCVENGSQDSCQEQITTK